MSQKSSRSACFVGASVSEPLLQAGILLSVFAYPIHLDPWMALGAVALFIPQFLFVPLMQAAVNRRAGSRIRILRQLGIGVIDQSDGHFRADERRIDRAFALDMGIFRLKFTMNFLMNLCSHLQIVSALLIGGWWVYTDRLAIGGVVAVISGIGRLNDRGAISSTTFATSASIRSSTACWRTRSTSSLASSPMFREPRCVELPAKRSGRRFPSKAPPPSAAMRSGRAPFKAYSFCESEELLTLTSGDMRRPRPPAAGDV